MALYKVKKCKEKAFNTHDKRICMYWHSKSDRRRNPFEIPYACTECANQTETVTCADGDKCLRAHNMLERMFHPELYKITICQQGSKCERGKFCAFAHSDEDRRIPQSHTKGTLDAATGSLDHIQPGKLMSDSKLLDSVQDKLVRLIKVQGADGIISSELPKRYYEIYSERLELTDEAGEKFRIKDLLLSHAHISVTMHKGVQPKYVYTEEAVESSELDARMIPTDDAQIKKDAVTAADLLNQRRRGPSSPLTIDLSMDPTIQQPTSSFNFATAPSDKSMMNGLGFNSGGFNGISMNQNQLGSSSLGGLGSFNSMGTGSSLLGNSDLFGQFSNSSLLQKPISTNTTNNQMYFNEILNQQNPVGNIGPNSSNQLSSLLSNFSNNSAVYQGSGRLDDNRPNTAEYADKIAQAKSACNVLQQQIYVLQEINNKKDEEMKSHSFQLLEANKLLNECKESYKNDKDKISNDLMKIKNDLSSLQKKFSEKENELISTKKALELSNAELHKLDLTKNSLVPELKQLRTKLGTVEQALEKSKAQLESSDKARSVLENEAQSLKSHNEALLRQIAQFETQYVQK